MKSLISYPKHALSTFLVFFVFLMIAEAQNLTSFSQVRRQDGLLMQRLGPNNVGKINYIYNEEHDQGFMYMRATNADLGNNCIVTKEGLFLVNHDDPCRTGATPLPTFDPVDNIKLFINGGTAKATGDAFWSVASDQRLKKNISPLKNSLEILQEVEFVEFEYNGLAQTPTDKKYYGVLAQQVKEVLPNTVKTFSRQLNPSHKSNTELLIFNPNDLMYTGLNAIKELATTTEEQYQGLVENLEEEKRKNKILENRVNELENKLEKLINSLTNQPQETSNSVFLSEQRRDKLHSNVPNPLNHSTSIKYELSQVTDKASILIQDMYGKVLQQIILPKDVKNGTAEFNATNAGLSSGTYIYVLVVDGQNIDSKKMIFIE